MNYQEFIRKIVEDIKPRLSTEETVEVKTTIKNNGVVFQGLLFQSPKTNVFPTIYLEPYYELYNEGCSLKNIVDKIWTSYQKDIPQGNIDMDFLLDFGKTKEHIIYMLINYEMNKNRLQDIPHIRFWDLVIVFCYVHSSEELGDGTILISNHLLDIWNISVEGLAKIAKINTPKLFPPMFCDLKKILENQIPYISCSDENLIHFYFLSNEKKIHGASVIIYPDLLSSIGKMLQQNFYVIPSSIHECLILPMEDAQNRSGKDLHNIITEINQTAVNDDEILSNYPFLYDYKANTLTQLTSFD